MQQTDRSDITKKSGFFIKLVNGVPFILQIIAGMIIGIVLALLIPEKQVYISMFGDLFVSGLKIRGLFRSSFFFKASFCFAKAARGSEAFSDEVSDSPKDLNITRRLLISFLLSILS